MTQQDAQSLLIATCVAMSRMGLTHAKSGNASMRSEGDGFFVTPTGVNYDELEPAHIPLVRFDGTWQGDWRPSSEWRFHRDIYMARPDVNAIVHTHSRHATALASCGMGIPAFHYMVAAAGGSDIRCAPYATFGTQALSDLAVAALADRKACLLANHGVIATGQDLQAALRIAGEVENLAAQYVIALQVGVPAILGSDEMARVLEQFKTYGRQDVADDGLRRKT